MGCTEDIERQILKKLDTLIRLLAHQVAMGHDTLKIKALTLNSQELAPAEIAKICGTTPGTIRARLAEAREKRNLRTNKKKKT